MLLMNSSNTNNASVSTTTSSGFTMSSVSSSNTTNSAPMSPLTTINESWINVFNDRTAMKPSFQLGIEPTLALGNNANASIPLPGFVLLQHIYAQRSEIIPVYYQLIAFLFRQIPSDDVMEQTEVRNDEICKR